MSELDQKAVLDEIIGLTCEYLSEKNKKCEALAKAIEEQSLIIAEKKHRLKLYQTDGD